MGSAVLACDFSLGSTRIPFTRVSSSLYTTARIVVPYVLIRACAHADIGLRHIYTVRRSTCTSCAHYPKVIPSCVTPAKRIAVSARHCNDGLSQRRQSRDYMRMYVMRTIGEIVMYTSRRIFDFSRLNREYDVKLIRTDDSIDPQARTCFNCWQDDHERINCRKKQTRDFCYNCGRVGVQMPDCPRCGEGYVRWLARHPEKRASATKPSQAPKPETRRPGPKVHVPPKAFLDRYPDEPERNHYDRIRNALKGVEMLTQVRILKEYFPNGAPTSKAKRFDPTTQKKNRGGND
ncbi:unnamed protein product [Trichogramma brassicae]|uniref:CCHC-type domain-containing protein n=1 Tax=Trichogramma brassicae TaxID=86971 RepID=A0A6H5I6N7_9HYME|nr:unnamed protein product [Trichogramma brassicae]